MLPYWLGFSSKCSITRLCLDFYTFEISEVAHVDMTKWQLYFRGQYFEQIKITAGPSQTNRSTCWKELAAPGWSWLTPTEETTGRWAPSKLLSRIPTKWPNP